jgi:hypothetical protein
VTCPLLPATFAKPLACHPALTLNEAGCCGYNKTQN